MLTSDSAPDITPASAEEENRALRERVAILEQQLRHQEQRLRHQKFVEQKLQSKSEKFDPNQRELLFAQIEADQSLKTEAPPQPATRRENEPP